MKKTIIFGADHAGLWLKEKLLHWAKGNNYGVVDVGAFTLAKGDDYPDYIIKVVQALEGKEGEVGVLICGSGIGMSIGANRFKGIRAALCWNAASAYCARQHNDANILALGERLIGDKMAIECLEVFLTTPFKQEDRHMRRIEKLDALI